MTSKIDRVRQEILKELRGVVVAEIQVRATGETLTAVLEEFINEGYYIELLPDDPWVIKYSTYLFIKQN